MRTWRSIGARVSGVSIVAALLLAGPARAQCLLANPSFEIAGSSGNVFAGWNQFGVVGSSSTAVHGVLAARVSGPNTGNWDVSGYWQAQSTSPGERWRARGTVRTPSAARLAGQSRAIVNIEWRDAGGALISYESHDVATAASPADSNLAFDVSTATAPPNTASARLLLGVLQGPGDPQRDAIYDAITFEKQTTPSLDSLQWGDFGTGRTLFFAGRTWRVKGTGVYGPGPNSFSASPSMIWVDDNGWLHLTITKSGATWYSTEAALTTPLGYGDYVFTTRGRLDQLDKTDVLGLFVWQYGPCYDGAYLWWNPYNETDIEFSRWGIAGGPNAQFVTQPYDWAGNRHQFTATFSANEITSHAFRWRPDRIEYRSWRGAPAAESTSPVINAWTYTGPHVPRPDQPRVHVNLWQFAGAPATNQEVVLTDFRFAAWPPAVLDVPALPPAPAAPLLALAIASRNPAHGGATLRCTLPRAGLLRVAVYDPAGRLVRTLADGAWSAGTSDLAWDGRDADGARVAPGVYLARAQSGAASAVTRLVVLP